MLSIAICDDACDFCKELENYIIEYLSGKKLEFNISIFHSSEDILSSPEIFDIAFLDVEMSGLSGIHAGKELTKRNKHMIFFIITSFEDYLDEALRFHAFRYLSKPLDKNRLFRNLDDAIHLYTTTSTKIAIETKHDVHTVLSSDIIMVEARLGSVIVYTPNETYYSTTKMNDWEARLPKINFFRCHRSFIVNFNYVNYFDNYLIHLCNSQYKAYLTMRKYSEFKHEYFVFLEHIG
ncbi:MAG: LytTR family DNA-binding domain-containing protein [Clostridium sp.]|nr:LytTR family DNA-binding domain-containing protein [Clostridium sp.]MCM1171059.1 LytTR family DNA-binding domain-containing protein [Clostridium sp.]MCM1209968.1 LytTR family DNA-binding domain-containing protein [Ruminococcus sp.]